MNPHKVLNTVAVLGAQWGDEGKGKLVDNLAPSFDLCCRFNGGSNAGHTIVANGVKFAFHLLPSGILEESTICVLGNGVVVNPNNLLSEMATVRAQNIKISSENLKISDRCHIVLDLHKMIDGFSEEELGINKIGTTKQGIGPCFADKSNRLGIRICDIVSPTLRSRLERLIENHRKRWGDKLSSINIDDEIQQLQKFYVQIKEHIVDTVHYLNAACAAGKRILVEGANAAMLDIDLGTYPFVTSSSTTISSIFSGLGLNYKKLDCAVGVIKAYTTRVGEGPFPTELENETGERIRRIGGEFGTTTGRPRRCGWLDLVLVKYTHMLNGYDYLNLTKIDILTGLDKIRVATGYFIDGKQLPGFPSNLDDLAKVEVEYKEFDGWTEDLPMCRTYDELPANCRAYIEFIENEVGVPIRWIGVGPQREAMIIHDV
ncbi:Adenylosuccinate synthase [uncultured virus]|nr:Adenylosuccinate synthase [uncultured virus]